MSAKGWLLNTAGFWIERARGSARERLDRTRQSGDLSEPVLTTRPQDAQAPPSATGCCLA